MDKTEYQIKLDEINRLIDLQEYEEALEIVDTIEWKRVKSVRTLCMVAEIYEINGELEESMRILQLAYKRSSLGKTILYRQVELALKMKKYNDAVKYYNKYLEAASNDTTKYILKYKIYKAQKAPLEDLIAILEEYKEREYTERWVYELARLYKQAENQRKCVETCDDLILWFGEGKYVIKAMELKMTFVPLTTAQKAKYDQYMKQEASQTAKPVKPAVKSSTDIPKSGTKTLAEPAKAMVKTMAEPMKSSVKPSVEPVKTVKLPTDPAKAIVRPPVENAKSLAPQKKLVPPSFESISAAARNTSQKAPNFIKKELTFVPPVVEEDKELLKEAAVTIEPEKKVVEKELAEKEVKIEEVKIEEVKIEEVKIEEVAETEEVSNAPIIEEEPSIESILAAAAVEIMAEKAEEEQVEVIEEPVKMDADISEEQPIQNKAVDNEELQKNLAKSLEQVFSGLHRTEMVQSFDSFGRYVGSEIPKVILDEENLEDYLMKELAPENADDTVISIELEEEPQEIEMQEEEPQEIEMQEEEPQEIEMQEEEPQEIEMQEEEPQEIEMQEEEPQEIEMQEEELQEIEMQEEEPQEIEMQEEEPQEIEMQEEEPQEIEIQAEKSQEIENLLTDLNTNSEEESNLDIFDLDLEALFAETSSDFAKMIESFANEDAGEIEEHNELDVSIETEETSESVQKIEEEDKEPEESEEETEELQETEEENKEPEESEEEAEELQETEEENKESEESEEEAEELQETEEENKEPEESEEETEELQEVAGEESNDTNKFQNFQSEDEIDAEAAMLAFEASLLDGLNRIPGLESYQFETMENSEAVQPIENEESFDEELSAENEKSSDEELLVENEESFSEELPVENEESSSEELPAENEESSSEELPAETEELSDEELLVEKEESSSQEVLGEEVSTIEAISTEDVSNELEIKEIIANNTLMEVDNGFDIDFEAKLVAETESFLNTKDNDKKPEQEMDLVERLMMEADKEPSTYQSMVDETPEDKRRRILNENCQTVLSDEQKALFSYFCKVPGMNNQILDAINGVYRYADERTSRRGNIAIMGRHGMGKTRLGESLVKAICKQFGIQAAKYARIDALELNKKDIATVVGKMAGGFLMVERAHLMTPAAIGQLATAMEFRTDSMVLIIEDEKAEMRQLLKEYPHFAEKFETVISIPVFTNDELVTFARTYAKENGFKMDELGVLALYALIGDNQREDEPVTIGRVKSMVDAAIRHATSARLGRRLSKRHVDEDGRILLYEKDFED